jgi:hypothetical protein
VNDPGEIVERVEIGFGHVRQAKNRDRHLRYDVAVGLAILRHPRGPYRACCTRPVFHDHPLAQVLAGRIGKRAHRDVCATSRTPRHDQRDRPLGKILRAGDRR